MIPDDGETEEEAKAAYQRLVERLKADGVYKEDETDDSFNSWEVGIKPGLSIALNSKLNFITHFGFLGYRDTDEGSAKSWGKDGLGFDFSGNNLTFGLNYHF
mgnify:CR=1 FL=1